jgi:hypothetical protein
MREQSRSAGVEVMSGNLSQSIIIRLKDKPYQNFLTLSQAIHVYVQSSRKKDKIRPSIKSLKLKEKIAPQPLLLKYYFAKKNQKPEGASHRADCS